MPLYIGTTPVTPDQSFDTLCREILRLPEPAIHGGATIIRDEEARFCVQREILIATKDKLESKKIKYLGATGVTYSIVLYIESDDDCVLAYADNCGRLQADLGSVFAKFKSRNTIRVKLVGGEDRVVSREHLQEIITALKNISERFSCDIHIEQQFLWPSNKATPEDVEGFLYDRMCRKIAMAYQHLFQETFNFSDLGPISPADFQKRLPEGAIPEIYNTPDMQLPTAIIPPPQRFLGLLNTMRPVVDQAKWRLTNHLIMPFLFPDHLPEQEKKALFVSLAKALFSIEGKAYILAAYQSILQTGHLYHFVFSLASGDIIQRGLRDVSLPNEYYRRILPLDFNAPMSYAKRMLDARRLPVLSREFLAACAAIEARVQSRLVDTRALDAETSERFYVQDTISILDLIYTFIQSEDYLLAKLVADPSKILAVYDEARKNFRENDFPAALKKFTLALEANLILHGAHSLEVGRCYAGMASCYRDQGLFTEAMEAAEKGLTSFHHAPASANLEAAFNHLVGKYCIIIDRADLPLEELHSKAVQFFNEGNLRVATELAKQAAEKFMAQDNKGSAATSYSVLASCYRDQKQYPEAFGAAERSLYLRQIMDPPNQAAIDKAEKKRDEIRALMSMSSEIAPTR